MKRFNRLFLGVIALIIATIVVVNIYIIPEDDNKGRPYQVEVSRLVEALNQGEKPDLKAYEYVKAYSECRDNEDITKSGQYDYCIRQVKDKLYRIDYVSDNSIHGRMIFIVNAAMLICGLLICLALIIIKRRIVKPFHELEDVPYQLSKGNLTIPIEENRYKLFGRFVWGTNILRENINERRKDELELHKEKKTVLLSLAHDIKTPLSVIKLNAQAIEKGLYNDEESRNKAACDIVTKVDEIGNYVNQIVDAARDDFLKLEVINGEYYLSELVDRIRRFYNEKMGYLKIHFTVEDYEEGLLFGDIDRMEEVVQNLIENAIKYGDGRHITLSFPREEGCQLITVSNSGNSLPTEESSHLFESFYRGSNSEDQEGSGLGLYICRKLMSQMKGDIFIHSDEDIFRISLVTRFC